MSDPERLRRYLLATLSEAEAEELEQRLLVDQDLHERLALEQDALMEGYLRGTLPSPERALFEARLQANPVLADEVRHARLLHQHLTAGAPARRTRRYWPAAAAALVLLGAGVWWRLIRTPEAPRTIGEQALPSPTPRPTVTPAATATPSPATVAALTLSPGQTMAAGGAARILLGPSIDHLRVDLVLDEPLARGYGVEVWSESGQRMWGRPQVRPDRARGALTVTLPAPRFAVGRYRLQLEPANATGPADTVLYYFEVLRN